MLLGLTNQAMERIAVKMSQMSDIYFDFGSDVSGADQFDGWYMAKEVETDTPLGYVQYSIWDNICSINMIEVKEEYKGQGVGEALLNHMMEDQGISYDQINWGMMTEEGGYLKNKMDSKYGLDKS